MAALTAASALALPVPWSDGGDPGRTRSNLIRIDPTTGLVVEGYVLARALRMLARSEPPVFERPLYVETFDPEEPARPRVAGIYAELEWFGLLPIEPGIYTTIGFAFGGQCREWVSQRERIRRRLTTPTIEDAKARGYGVARLLALAKLPAEAHAEQMRAWASRDLRELGRVGSPMQAVGRARDLVDDAERRLVATARRDGVLNLFDFQAFEAARAALLALLDSPSVRGF